MIEVIALKNNNKILNTFKLIDTKCQWLLSYKNSY